MCSDAKLRCEVPHAGIGARTVVGEVKLAEWRADGNRSGHRKRRTEGWIFVVRPDQTTGALNPRHPTLALREVPAKDRRCNADSCKRSADIELGRTGDVGSRFSLGRRNDLVAVSLLKLRRVALPERKHFDAVLEVALEKAAAQIGREDAARVATDEEWERLPSIFTFSLRAPHAPERCLTPAEARNIYVWLNTDLSALLPDEDAALAARICHIGQPVPLAQPQGDGQMGALRVSAGARLISGEPSHRPLGPKARLAREFADLALVFDKISLILRHWQHLTAANPAASYRPTTGKPKALVQ